MSPRSLPWWQRTTVYQIYPRSFQDGNGDGIGDLAGIVSRLDALRDLGVETLWLSPIFDSPQADFGYDVRDYTAIAPEYGTFDECMRLIDAVHARGMKIVFDMVLNHTSIEHPWFVESRRSKDSPLRDFYVWRPGRGPGGRLPPNNWQRMVGGNGWNRDARTGEWFWSSFLPFQPDLNYRNPEVERRMLDVVRFWLGRGVDGLRLDIFNALFEDASFADNPPSLRLLPTEENPSGFFQHFLHTSDHPDTLAFTRRLRAVVDEFDDPPRFLVGEVFGSPAELRRYTGERGEGLHTVFLFETMRTPLEGPAVRALIESFEAEFPAPLIPTWVFGNHDRLRNTFRLGDDPRKAKLQATLQLTARGVPFVYYGEEIAMPHVDLPFAEALDPLARRFRYLPGVAARGLRRLGVLLNRDESRTPMQWDEGPHAGFAPAHARPWRPLPPNARSVNVAAQSRDPRSVLHAYRALLRLRAAHPALHAGRLELHPVGAHPREVVAYTRRADGADERPDVVHVWLNVSERPASITLPSEPGARVWSTHTGEREAPVGPTVLAPFEGLVHFEPLPRAGIAHEQAAPSSS